MDKQFLQRFTVFEIIKEMAAGDDIERTFAAIIAKKVFVLLDEYDTPMQEAYGNGCWEELLEDAAANPLSQIALFHLFCRLRCLSYIISALFPCKYPMKLDTLFLGTVKK